MSVSGSKQPYRENVLPRNVHRPLEWSVGTLFGGFGDIRSVSEWMNKASFREILWKWLWFRYLSMWVDVCKPQHHEKYVHTTSGHGARFVPIIRAFVIGDRYDVRYTRLNTKILFRGILGSPYVSTATMKPCGVMNTPNWSAFYALSIDVNIMTLSSSVYKLWVTEYHTKRSDQILQDTKCRLTSYYALRTVPMLSYVSHGWITKHNWLFAIT